MATNDLIETYPKTTQRAWMFLLHAHDHCLHADGQIILHRLMVQILP